MTAQHPVRTGVQVLSQVTSKSDPCQGESPPHHDANVGESDGSADSRDVPGLATGLLTRSVDAVPAIRVVEVRKGTLGVGIMILVTTLPPHVDVAIRDG